MARKQLSFETQIPSGMSFFILKEVAKFLSRPKTVIELASMKVSNQKDFNSALGDWVISENNKPLTIKMIWRGWNIKKTINIQATLAPLGEANALITLDANMAGLFDSSGHLDIPLNVVKETFEKFRTALKEAPLKEIQVGNFKLRKR